MRSRYWDISNPNPVLIKNYPTKNPYGLAMEGMGRSLAGEHGFGYYDITSELNIRLTLHAFDLSA